MDSQEISNNTGHRNNAAKRAPKLIFYSIVGAVFLSLTAIAAGLLLQNDDAGLKASEVFASQMKLLGGDEGADGNEAQELLLAAGSCERSSRLAYEAKDGQYVIFQNYSEDKASDPESCLFWDRENGQTELLVDKKVEAFCVMQDMLYFTTYNDETRNTALFQKELLPDAEEELLLDTGLFEDFYCCRGMIFYVNANDEYRLYGYDTETGENRRLCENQIGLYDIWNGMIYYADRFDGTLWKMRLDGTKAEQIELPADGRIEGHDIRICRYRGTVYLAVRVRAGGRSALWLIAEDGAGELMVYEYPSEPESDGLPDIDCRNGRLYYSSSGAIRVLDMNQRPDGESGILPESRELFLTGGSMIGFEVTEHFVFLFINDGQYRIRIYDIQENETVMEYVCEELWNLPEETGETARHAAHLALPEPDGEEYGIIFRRYGYDVSDAYGFGDSTELSVRYMDENGERAEPLVTGNVRRFLVVGDMLFYTYTALRDTESRDTALFCKNLTDSREPECLIGGGVAVDFVYYGDSIWYVNRYDGSRLYCYELKTGRNIRISDVEVGSYDLWDNTVYYENISDRTLCKMRLDGTGNEEITVPGHENGAWLFQLRVCPYRGKVYLACTTGHGNSLLLFAEDGSAVCWIAGELGSEINQGFYYEDSRLYYSTGWVHVFDVGQYIDDGGMGAPDAYDVTFFDEYHGYEAFEVTDEFVFGKLFWYPHTIEVYDRLTGGFVEEIDCRSGQEEP